MLFLVVSLVICIAGSLIITWLMDLLHVSPLFFGKQRALISY